MAARPIQRVNWWHERIVDWELMNPDATLGQCAAFFDVTQPWLSTIRHSDAFIEYRTKRIAEHQEMLSKSVIDKVEDLAHLTLDTLKSRIDEERKTVSLAFLRETTDSALKALGYSSNRGQQPAVQIVNINSASPEALARARDKLRAINAPADKKELEFEAVDRVEVPAAS